MLHKLYIDIETFAAVGYYWGRSKYEQDIIDDEYDWYILCYSYAIDDGPIKTVSITDFPRFKHNHRDDKDLVMSLARLLDEASIVIAHNALGFDLKKINARVVVHRGYPPTPYKTVDTLKVSRKHFGFSSNKLNDIAQALGIGKKLPHTGWDLWKGCAVRNDPKSWKLMREYNAHDIYLLREVYKRFLPWIDNHPHMGMGAPKRTCPNCGSAKAIKNGVTPNVRGEHQRWRCRSCGKSFMDKEFLKKFKTITKG